MDDLVEFLRARVADDEAGVRALAEPHDWHAGPGDDPEWTDEELVCMWPPEYHTPYERDKHWRGLTVPGPALAAHVARYDPGRALREVEAKRRMLRHYESAVVSLRNTAPGSDLRHLMTGAVNTVRAVLADHAAVYADHPDYRPEWAPTA